MHLLGSRKKKQQIKNREKIIEDGARQILNLQIKFCGFKEVA